jgi:hypothetical protein
MTYRKVDQPKAVLTQILFEPNCVLNDSLSHDITAWAPPLAYGVEGYALKNTIMIKNESEYQAKLQPIIPKVFMSFIFHGITEFVQVLSILHSRTSKRSAMKSDFGDIVVEPGGLTVQGRQFKIPI